MSSTSELRGALPPIGVGDAMTEADILNWLSDAAAPRRARYFRGSRCEFSPVAAKVASRLYESGHVLLVRRRIADELYDFMMDKRS